MSKLPIHVDLEGFSVDDNCLCVSGRKLTEIANEINHTPFYLYDAGLVGRRIGSLRQLLPAGIRLHYAMKANPHPELVNFVARRVDGIDVASQGELEIALRSGIAPAAVSFAGPGKLDKELERAVSTGVTINLESWNEALRLQRIAETKQRIADVAIRVNPAFELKASGMRMSGGPKPFGIDAEAVPDVLRELKRMRNLHFRGFHIFSGSQNLDASSIADAQEKTIELSLNLAAWAPSRPEYFNIGGGFGIPLFPGDRSLDIAAIGARLQRSVALVGRQLPGTSLVIELGRYLVGEAGVYVCRVVDKKISRGTTFLVADGGLHHHLSASGNFGQVIRKNYPVVVGNRVYDQSGQRANLVGPLCTPLDVLGDKMPLGHAEVGDFIVIFQSGAYGASASPIGFLGHEPPREFVLNADAPAQDS